MSHARPAAPMVRGAALVFALILVAVLAVVGVAVIRFSAQDRMDSARLVVRERALTCAESALQYGRRYFGCRYASSQGWKTFLSSPDMGRLDPSLGDAYPTDVEKIPLALRGDANGDGILDPGTDLDGDGKSDFYVSIRDDDDERPLGAPDDRTRDNNLTVILRAECTNRYFANTSGNQLAVPVIEAYLTHVQGSSGYGTPSSASNSMDASTQGNWVSVTQEECK